MTGSRSPTPTALDLTTGDDTRSLGAADIREPLADGRPQGADRKSRLRPLRKQQRPAGQRESLAGQQRGRSAEREPADRKRLDASGRHLRRRCRSPVRERSARGLDVCDRLDACLHRPVPDRRQRHLGRVLLRPARRSPPLQPRPLDDRGPSGHGDTGRAPTAGRYAGTERPRRARHDGWSQLGQSQLDCFYGQHRCRPLQRPPQHDRRLHACCGEPHRPAHWHELHRSWRSRPARTTTASPPRMPPAT